MQIAMVGLGRMGGGMVERLRRGGHDIVVYDIDPAAVAEAVATGVRGVASLEALVAALEPPRAVWVMVPAGHITQAVLGDLAALLSSGDVCVDGGNSKWSDSAAQAAIFAGKDIAFVDAGVSGGVWGLEHGYCLMVGGTPEGYAILEPVLRTLAPQGGGLAHVGAAGAGHFTKMVHNGIEYAMMQAYAEGFELLRAAPFGIDAGTAAEVWQTGSVVRSWLLDLAVRALQEDPALDRLSGYVEDSGEGRWAVEAAVELGIPAPAMTLALFTRFSSREPNAFSNRMLAALRQQFGGHAVRMDPSQTAS